MALRTILEMVKSRLPYLPADNSMDPTIEGFKLEQFYYLQKWTLKDDADLEDENAYSGMQKMLTAELVCIELINKKTLEIVAGLNGANATAGKRIKKGKADVVEAEFDYGKSSDGTFLGKTAEQLVADHSKKACEYAQTLGYNLPLCGSIGMGIQYDVPPFISFENNNCSCG